jgi:hypothetical protein
MGELFFVFGSVVGAALAWLVVRGDRSRSMAATLTGVSCGLLGALTSMSGDTMAPVTQAGFGLLSAAAPLTLCVTSVKPAATTAGIASAAGRYGVTLLLALLYGTACVTVGFVSVTAVRHS